MGIAKLSFRKLRQVHYNITSGITKTTPMMSLRGKQNKILVALTGFGVLVVSNYYFKPPVPQAIELRMNRELDLYNATPHPEQDRT